jgi:2-oxoglutarate dehydrogenase E2 component (dihydrolipoamide succinyltransferase)
MFEMKVPSPGESISEVEIAEWLVKDGDYVEKDQVIAEVDSDKATLELPAEVAGVVTLKAEEGDTVAVGEVVCLIDTEAEAPAKKEETKSDKKEEESTKEKESDSSEKKEAKKEKVAAEADKSDGGYGSGSSGEKNYAEGHASPSAKKKMSEEGVSAKNIQGSGKNGRITKQDVINAMAAGFPTESAAGWGGTRDTERKKMSSLRRKVAERLVGVKNETAMLTTFNEVNMQPIMDMRNKYKEVFKENHGVGLGFMSFFTKAVTESLNQFPAVNAQIDGQEMVTHNYADIGIAVSSPKGLMVPVVRNAEQMSLAEIESEIKRLAVKARDGKITIDEMQGGTFTITNGGVFGSMMSTPIINPPQSAILGMHNIVERPMAVNGEVKILPMMYLALSYDHRIIDGKESVSFLVKVKEMLENPERMIFGGKSPAEVLLGL